MFRKLRFQMIDDKQSPPICVISALWAIRKHQNGIKRASLAGYAIGTVIFIGVLVCRFVILIVR